MIRARAAALAACDVFDITEHQIYHRSHAARYVRPRHVAFWIARLAGRTYPQIARAMNRDQSTIRHGVLRITALMENDETLRARVEDCQARLT